MLLTTSERKSLSCALVLTMQEWKLSSEKRSSGNLRVTRKMVSIHRRYQCLWHGSRVSGGWVSLSISTRLQHLKLIIRRQGEQGVIASSKRGRNVHNVFSSSILAILTNSAFLVVRMFSLTMRLKTYIRLSVKFTSVIRNISRNQQTSTIL